MINLNSVKEYIEETVNIISMATGMETILADRNGNVLGDTNLDEFEDHRASTETLSETSVIRRCMRNDEILILTDAKNQNPPCKTCVNVGTCNINAMIALPIKDGKVIIGGICLYSYDKRTQDLIRSNDVNLIGFVEKIADMFVTKAREKAEKATLKAANEQMRLLFESMEEPLVSLNSDNEVVNLNRIFLSTFNLSKNIIKTPEDLLGLFNSDKLREFLYSRMDDHLDGKAAFTIDDDEVIVTFKPIFADDYCGALLSFKKGSDVYKDIKIMKDNYYFITFNDIIGVSPKIRKVKADAERFAQGPSNIFIRGESGTGKEMFARAIHNASLVENGPFVAVNCAAIPENLIESELFGHKEGAFTGSMKGGKTGKFQQANGGTLFLDEIGEMPIHLQAKLLRAIQEKRIQPIGSNDYISVDIRIISATNRDIEHMVEEGLFREDLYYRLNVIPLEIPSLKDRTEDIPELLEFFLDKFNSILDKNIINFDRESREILLNYDWPGNIRELQNVVEYAVNACNGKFIVKEHLPQRTVAAENSYDSRHVSIRPMKEIEEFYILEALKTYGKSTAGKKEAAAALGMSNATFYRKLGEMGLIGKETDKTKNSQIKKIKRSETKIIPDDPRSMDL